jgi:cupin superfamily acireductone dioxygenase involved in methionine salvage
MHYKNFYTALSEDDIFKRIKEDGFEPFKVANTPNFIYYEHSHPETKLLVILEGDMELVMNDKKVKLEPKDKFIVPGNTLHSSVVGKNGCVFFWSEKLIIE